MPHRREFLKIASAMGIGLLAPQLVSSCSPRTDIKVSVKGPDYARGHQVWNGQKNFGTVEKIEKQVVVVGAGISGLSTAYFLKKQGIEDVLLLELNDAAGGNSSFGNNAYSAFPHGAHYLSQPNIGNEPLINFLSEKGIVTGRDAQGRLLYNDTDLCFDPEERLLLKGTFQEGLIPSYTLSNNETQEIKRFLQLMEFYRQQKGSDGKFLFDIPYSAASADARYDALDSTTFRAFLSDNGFRGNYLLWYVDYCCRDDFGGGIDKVSAWAGINYFASHRPHPSNTDVSRVLTWPEGNGHLVNLLLGDVGNFVRTGCLVRGVRLAESGVVLDVADFHNQRAVELSCKYCVLAIPPFVVSRVLDSSLPYPRHHVQGIQHAPWIVASLVLAGKPGGRGLELCWDNVGYRTRALGYIYNQHQNLTQREDKACISLYIPLDEKAPAEERKAMLARSEQEWKELVLSELERMHPGIAEAVEEIEVWRWGHGMAMPSIGLVKGGSLQELARPIDNKIFFAHTDLTGYSTFEEAFDWGHRTADAIGKVWV